MVPGLSIRLSSRSKIWLDAFIQIMPLPNFESIEKITSGAQNRHASLTSKQLLVTCNRAHQTDAIWKPVRGLRMNGNLRPLIQFANKRANILAACIEQLGQLGHTVRIPRGLQYDWIKDYFQRLVSKHAGKMVVRRKLVVRKAGVTRLGIKTFSKGTCAKMVKPSGGLAWTRIRPAAEVASTDPGPVVANQRRQ